MERNLLFDSFKFSLIVLVIIGHAIPFSEIPTPLHFLGDFIYSFHMPAFIFISGFFSKNITREKFLKSGLRLFETYIVIQIIYILAENIELTLSQVIFGSKMAWFLASLISWRFLILCAKSLPKKFLIPAFVLSIALSFLIGFLPSDFNQFSLFRTFVFFPFFFLGYLTNEDFIIKARGNKLKYLLLLYIPVAIGFIYMVQKYHLLHILFGTVSYHDFYRSYLLLIAFRVSAFINALILIYLFFFMVPEKLPFCAEKRGKDVLIIYLFHVLVIMGLSKLFSIGPYTNLVLYSLISLIVCLLLSKFRYIDYIMNPVTKSISSLKCRMNKKDC